MNPKFFSDEELKAAFESVKRASLKGERVRSWSASGASVTKESNSGASDAARGNLYAREIQYRIHEGRMKQEDFPGLPGIPRPPAERISV